MEYLTIVLIVVTIVGFIPLYKDFFTRRKEYEDNIIITPFYEHPNDPIDKDLRIRIRNLNRTTVYTDKVMYNDERLDWANEEKEPYSQKIIEPGGGINVLVPKKIQTENPEIRVLNGKDTVKKVKLSKHR